MADKELTGICGSYRITFSPALGSGVFGTVHKAVHIRTQEKLAAKQLILSGSQLEREHTLREAQKELNMIQKVQGHQNIVKLYDQMHINNAFWIFMELCDMGDLHDYMEKNPNIEIERKIKIMLQSSSGVAYMHKQHQPIVHRDIKPKNIMLKRFGDAFQVKLTDFGFSKLVFARQSLSTAFTQDEEMSSLRGSPYFMAPEFSAELESGLKYDKSVDTFALGLVFQVLLQCLEYRDLTPLSGYIIILLKY